MSERSSSADWAQEARDEREFFAGLSIPELHALIANRKFGSTNAIFYALAERSTLSVSAWPLLEVLERRSVNRDFRYHAANALLRLMDSHDWSAEQLANDEDPEFEVRLRDFRRQAMQQART
jgi:hypothetical protein